MKTTDKSAKSNRNFDRLISKLSGDEILNLNSMMHVRGGDGNGSEIIITPPPKPVQLV
jgi:hypothetical protein